MNPYFICSLPRSRTAWLANFLTFGASFCFHEPFNEYAIEELPKLFVSMNREHVGISDSLSTYFMDTLLATFPQAKLVVIRRPFEEVDKRLRELGVPCTDLLRQWEEALNEIVAKYDPLVVNYHRFDPEAIWYFLMPDVPLNRPRLQMLENFNVTVPMAINIRKGREFIEKWITV